MTQVTNAWNAVGVGSTSTGNGCSDTYEANETLSAAKAIAVNNNIIARIGSATDKDWYSFTTTAAAPKLKVTLGTLPADYDIRLYNASGTQLGISQSSGTASESISYNSSSGAATYYVQVYGYSSAYSTTSCYTLRAATSNVNQLIDDGDNTLTNGFAKPVDAASTDALSVFPNPAKDQLTPAFRR